MGADIASPDEVVIAQRDKLAASLRAVLALIDRKQHLWPKEQAIVFEAEAVLVEVGR